MKVHFIGIGGIGISALAKFYLYKGYQISGSDLSLPVVFTDEEFSKIKFYLGHKEENLDKDIDLVIYTSAVSKDNPELLKAKKLKIKTLSYPQALGEITKNYFTIAVSGMHGKSTTTAMIAKILISAKMDPTVIIGSKVKGFGSKGEPSNFRYGESKFLIIEADEYKAGFLNHYPDILVVTNIEEEHLDYFKNLKNILKTFREFILKLKKKQTRFLVVNREDENIKKLLKGKFLKGIKVKYYSTKNIPKNLKLKVPGKHNLSNAIASLKVAEILRINKKIAFKALNSFEGIWRRLEFKGKVNFAKIFDDYGHHPTEIKATLQAGREILKNKGRLFVVYQPHQYHRTFTLFDKFIHAFDLADFVILLDIYSVAGRESEKIKKKVNSKILAEKISEHKENVFYFDSFKKAISFLRNNLKKNDVCIIMGAGDIWKLTEKLMF